MDITQAKIEVNKLQSFISDKERELDAENIKKIQSLDWISTTSGTLDIGMFIAAGIPPYQINLYSHRLPSLNDKKPVVLIDNGNHYSNIVLHFDNSFLGSRQPYIATYTLSNFLDFLHTYKFERLSYRGDLAKIYKVLSEKYEN